MICKDQQQPNNTWKNIAYNKKNWKSGYAGKPEVEICQRVRIRKQRNFNEKLIYNQDPMPAEWYVLRSKPNREELLLDQLLIRKMETYSPLIRVKPVNPRSRHIRAYFPGYFFAISGGPIAGYGCIFDTRWTEANG